MEERVGAYRINKKGEIVPDMSDHAMKERLKIVSEEVSQEDVKGGDNNAIRE